jgi:hypothetical protein
MVCRINIALVVCFFALTGSAWSQREAPPGASDKGAMDRSSKERSIELERIKRDANKPDAKGQQVPEPEAAAKFEEIKADFEGLQRRQDEILKAYTTGKQVDLDKIVSDSEQMNKHAVRLETNLFPPAEEQKGKKKSKENKTENKTVDPPAAPLPQDLKTLIVEQDNTLASFVSNPMFVNPQVANVTDNAKAHADLKKLISLTAALRSEAGKRPPLK